MKCHFMDEVVFTVGEDGVLEIGWSENGCRYRRLITSKNPISHLYVSDSSLHFRFYGSRDIYQMLWGWVKKCEKCPDRLMFWSGDGVDVPARTLYFVADLVREILLLRLLKPEFLIAIFFYVLKFFVFKYASHFLSFVLQS